MSRRVIVTLYPGVQPLDLVGPHEVFAGANLALEHLSRPGPRYELIVAAASPGPVTGESGLGLVATHAFAELAEIGAADTILVPGGDGAIEPPVELVDWLRNAAARCERLVTVCTGAFVAAAAGLCDGRRVTTHWARAGQLAAAYPGVTVDPDPIYLRDDDLWTSAGVTAGIDLALALVEEDHGAEIARLVARHLVVYLHRPGGQSQFATPVWSRPTEAEPIRQAVSIIHEELDGDLSVDVLAERVGLSARHFTRRFRAEIGEPVGRHIERIRVEAARQVLEGESVGLDGVAARCGFGSAETMRRAFHRRLGVSPDAYRRQFSSTR